MTDAASLASRDLLVGADGANSTVRRAYEPLFQPQIEYGRNKYIWLGTPKLFHGLTLTFVEHPTGLYAAHSYKFDRSTSTFIVECGEATWRAAGLDVKTETETCAWLEEIFRDHLDGQPLLTKSFVKWLNFPLVRNVRWHTGDTVLLGDALHTAHFSIGSGTKLALEDAIELARALAQAGDPAAALPRFEQMRRPRVEQYQQAAMDSLRWFENMAQLHPFGTTAVRAGGHDPQRSCRSAETPAARPGFRRSCSRRRLARRRSGDQEKLRWLLIS